MKYGEKKTIEINSVDRKGRGCGEVNERPACVYFTIPGETVEGSFVGRKKGFKKFELDELITPSPHRVEPECPHAGTCGGCAWQHIDYAHQLELKLGLINETLEAGGIERLESIEPCPQKFHYRNRMDYCVGPEGQVGLKEPGRWNSYVDLETCMLLSPRAVEVLREFKNWIRENRIEPWNVFKRAGYVRYIVIREGKNTKERMVTIVTAKGDLPARDDLVHRLAPLTTTLYHGINPEITDLSISSKLELLHGEQSLTESVLGWKFAIHPNAFFQTNTVMAEKLLAKVSNYVANIGARILLDLYCGVGFFSIGVADAVGKVIGIELDDQAIASAKRNAHMNGIANATFTTAAAESLIWKDEKPDVVIIDPPRAGLHPKVVSTLLEEQPPYIIYVSCNYVSFARDFATLKEIYDIKELSAFDLFPHSPHAETVALLKRRTERG
ncbi:MAG: 23S rRNA (uracil(1939)-C(5))-methyltransferase RlmD [Patescibacteria group bacterium]|nr:23S rRNA (uracil(1939)-C(5))-methyltransferase RlmD [Patescibacteria group bacterium]